MSVIQDLITNQLTLGLAGGSAIVSALYLLRQVPEKILDAVKWRWTCQLAVFNEDSAFERVSEWLAELDSASNSRSLRLTSVWDSAQNGDVERLSPGLGTHFFWYRGRPVLVRRTLPDKSAVGGTRRLEDIHITTLGGSPQLIHDIVAEVREARLKMRGATIDVYIYRRHWRLACRRDKRPLHTVVLPQAQKDRLVQDVERFIGARPRYSRLGIPYRRGYLFEGPPGCGKTSLAIALASEFSRPLYALNLGSIESDDELIEAVADVPEHAILLIEDIDATGSTAKRRVDSPSPNVKPMRIEGERNLSLSALLNVLDGVFAREGRILIMTSNHPENIDAALLRPGRTDLREHIGPLEAKEIAEMVSRFGGSSFETPEKITAAELQERLLERAIEAEAAE